MTMLEKMARVLCKAEGHDPDGRFHQGGPCAWERYSARCRDLLNAVREPSAEALGLAMAADVHAIASPYREQRCWQVIVDAIREGRA